MMQYRAQEFLSPSRSSQSYGATEEMSADDNTPDKYGDSGDLDHLFPERLRHKKIGVCTELYKTPDIRVRLIQFIKSRGF